MPSPAQIKVGYSRRTDAVYFDTTQSECVWQPDVYTEASRVAELLGAVRFIDVGCGDGEKLLDCPPSITTIGIDFGTNLAHARAAAPDRDWREHDLDSDEPLPVAAQEAAGSIIVCADVIEHLHDPRRLLEKLLLALPHAVAIFVSTPERDLMRGLADNGPPGNPAHVQEWSIREFQALLLMSGMRHHTIGLTRSNDRYGVPHTTLAVIAPTHDGLIEVASLLIDRPASTEVQPAPPPRLSRRARLVRRLRRVALRARR